MPTVPRIIIMDVSGDVAQIIRGTLALLNRQYILIEMPSTENVLAEVEQSKVDLVVTAYQLPGKYDGIELANQVRHTSLDTPVIVLAQAGDPEPDPAVIEDAPFQFYARPTGEAFLRGVLQTLDGEAATAIDAAPAAMGIDYGPIPPIDVQPIREVIISLIRDVGAMGIILADRTGQILIDEGATGYIDRETMAVVLGPMFARVAEIGPLVGGNAWAMHYYNGERLDVYGLALGVHHLMGLVFEGANRRAMASVMMYGRQAAHQIIEMIGEAAYQVQQGQTAAPEAAAPASDQVAEEPAETKPRAKTQEVEISAEAESAEPMLEPVPNLDVDALFDQGIDESTADSLFDPDELSDLAASIDADDERRVGYDEAIDMGILDE